MSATLSYEPVKPKNYKTLGDKLKFILIDKFDLINGTQRLNNSHIPYLEGLVDAGIEDAKVLITNIKKYDEVDVFLEY
jgi:hypothetical protein